MQPLFINVIVIKSEFVEENTGIWNVEKQRSSAQHNIRMFSALADVLLDKSNVVLVVYSGNHTEIRNSDCLVDQWIYTEHTTIKM